MQLFYTDETNLDPTKSQYFVYGGIIIPCDESLQLSAEIEATRAKYHVPTDFLLKFNPKPDSIEHNEFSALKRTIIEKAIEHKCKFIVSIILHKIATSPDEARRFEINRSVYHFDCYLNRINDHGLVLVDRFTDNQIDSQLRERFSIGIRGLPYSKTYKLDRIVGYHYSAVGQSHFSSLIDIAIGSFRFAINAFSLNQTDKQKTASVLLKLMEPLFIRKKKIVDISLHFSPNKIEVKKYRRLYIELKNYLHDNGLDTEQEIKED